MNNGQYFNHFFDTQTPAFSFPSAFPVNGNHLGFNPNALNQFPNQQHNIYSSLNNNYLIQAPSQQNSNFIFPHFGQFNQTLSFQTTPQIFQPMMPFGATNNNYSNPYNYQPLYKSQMVPLNPLNNGDTLSLNQNELKKIPSIQPGQFDMIISQELNDKGRSETDVERSYQLQNLSELNPRCRNQTQQNLGSSQTEQTKLDNPKIAGGRGIMENVSSHNKEVECDWQKILNQKKNHPNDLSITDQKPQIRNNNQPNPQTYQEEIEKQSSSEDQVRKNKPQNNSDFQSDTNVPVLHFKITPHERNILHKLFQQNIQSAFKNILKGFLYCVNYRFETIFAYTRGNSGAVMQLDSPTKAQRKSFLQKFNKFIKNKKYNHKSIRQIIENPLYSSTLKHFEKFYAKRWIDESHFSNKEEIQIVLEYFVKCCDNLHLLFFLTKTSETFISA